MNVRLCVEHEVSITKTLRGFHFVKVVGATPWLCQWHGLQDMTEASSFHQLRLQMDSLGHVYMVVYTFYNFEQELILLCRRGPDQARNGDCLYLCAEWVINDYKPPSNLKKAAAKLRKVSACFVSVERFLDEVELL